MLSTSADFIESIQRAAFRDEVVFGGFRPDEAIRAGADPTSVAVRQVEGKEICLLLDAANDDTRPVARRGEVTDFFAGRSRAIPPLPWPIFAPALARLMGGRPKAARSPVSFDNRRQGVAAVIAARWIGLRMRPDGRFDRCGARLVVVQLRVRSRADSTGVTS